MEARRVEDILLRALRLGPQTIVADSRVFTLISRVDGFPDHCVATSPHSPYLFAVSMNLHGEVRGVNPNFWQPTATADLTHLNMGGVVQSLAELELEGEADMIESTARTVAEQIMALRGGRLWRPGAKPEQATLDMVVARQPEGWAALADAISPPDMLTTRTSELDSLTNALVALARQLLTALAN
jgi:hypothetical protein